MKKESEYEKQARRFLESTGTTMQVRHSDYGKYFPDDKAPRDIYEIILQNANHKYTFKFGQSIACSSAPGHHHPSRKVPTAYDVLACIQKYNPDSFKNFCSEMGYDEDSRSAHKNMARGLR